MQLQGKIAVVTGAASGLGRAIAARYVAAGATVAVADIDLAGAEAAAEALTAQGPGRASALAMDVTSEQEVGAGIGQVIAEHGGVDILVSNAGVQIVHPIEDFPFADWKRMLAIHLDGAFLTTRAVIPSMRARGGGTILYMGSVHSKEASKLKSAYVAAKHGLLGLARVVAKEGAAYGVRANVICPGFVRTPLVDRQIPEQARTLGISDEEVVKRVMLGGTVDGEFTSAEDIAEIALFFAAFPSKALTGQSLIASHGWVME